MGISIGWIALLLGVTGAQPADKNAAQITYTIRMVEAEGVAWRASVMSQLKPVTRQGSATVWTLPAVASSRLIKEFDKSPAVTVPKASRIVAFSGVPATIQVRENRKFVTKVSWNGDEASATGTPENLRVGWHTTLVGRKLDQGVLVKMVLEDTEVRAVHEMPIDAPSHAKPVDSATSGVMHGETKAKAVAALTFEGSPFESPSCPTAAKDDAATDKASCELDAKPDAAKKQKVMDLLDMAATAYASGKYIECEAFAKRALSVDPNELAATILVYKARMEKRFKAEQENHKAGVESYQEVDPSVIADLVLRHSPSDVDHCPTFKQLAVERARLNHRVLELPEIASQEILGEWLIPNGECLLVSFGPHTEADKDGKAVVRERLAFIEADAKPVAVTAQRAMTAPRYIINPAPHVLIAPPVVAPPAVFYMPYSPNATPLQGFPPAGAPMAPPVVFVPAPEVPLPSGPDFPWAATQAATQRARMRAMGVEPPPPVQRAPAAAAPGAPDRVTRMPAVPSRSIPEGIHVDGSKAKLPPLPEDEMDDDSAESESAEPRPSPQSKKPRKAEPTPADEGTTKASLSPDPNDTEAPVDTKTRARWLLEEARAKLVVGKYHEARYKAKEAAALGVKWGLFDDTPARVCEDIEEVRHREASRSSSATEVQDRRRAADESTTKASFVRPKSPTFILPSVFLPGSSVGFQFLLPITPLSIKLPFNQRLVIEIFGRVVPDRPAQTAD